jgi:hypothetical protein
VCLNLRDVYQSLTQHSLSTDERLLFAARSDNEELIEEIFDSGDFDINFQDG